MLSIIDHNGVERFLGNNIPEKGLTRAWPVFGDTPETPMILRSQWDQYCDPARENDPFLPYVHDQDGVGQCNCDATAAAAESSRLHQGLPMVQLSAADLYDRINGGADNGSLLEDAMAEMLKNGIGTVATVGTDIWRRGMKDAPAAERSRYKVLKAFVCPTFDHVMSAVIAGYRMVSGVMWFNNYTPDSDGWLPTRGTGRPGGHAVFGFAPAKRNGVYGIWHQNSWTQTWGRNGRCVFPESMYSGDVGGWWAIRSVTDEGGVVPPLQA